MLFKQLQSMFYHQGRRYRVHEYTIVSPWSSETCKSFQKGVFSCTVIWAPGTNNRWQKHVYQCIPRATISVKSPQTNRPNQYHVYCGPRSRECTDNAVKLMGADLCVTPSFSEPLNSCPPDFSLAASLLPQQNCTFPSSGHQTTCP